MPAADRIAAARAAFACEFGTQPRAVCDVPGRVNLIGEHIDYAGGSVLPFAIQYGISVAAGRSADFSPPFSVVDGSADRQICDGDSSVLLRIAADSPVQPDSVQLAAAQRLVEEVITRLSRRGELPAASVANWRLCVYSDLPPGAGLSSSAAFCVAVAGAVRAHGCAPLQGMPDALAICQLCRDAEEAATGVQCGLMDQYAIVFGKAGHAVHFDTQTLTHEYIPLSLPDAALAVIDSGQPRTLAASAYNERRAELAAGQPARLRHVESEKQRVLAACDALRAGDSVVLGQLLSASHVSLRDDYAVSTPQLDLLCTLLEEGGLAHGARLTGAGFGGNALALLHPAALEPGAGALRQIDVALAEYERQTGLLPVLRLIEPGDGAQVVVGPYGVRPDSCRDGIHAVRDAPMPTDSTAALKRGDHGPDSANTADAVNRVPTEASV